jgi:hypothetical protein
MTVATDNRTTRIFDLFGVPTEQRTTPSVLSVLSVADKVALT